MLKPNPEHLFHVDGLALVLMLLVAFIGLCIAFFAARYLRGDRHRGRFFALMTALCATVAAMVSADHLLLLWLAWGMANLLLVRLMVHGREWRAAQAAGWLAGRNFLLGFVLIGPAFGLLYLASGEVSVQAILQAPPDAAALAPAMLLLLVGAATQSAIWPFHRWLTSSLNSPTPVSALMHAGLVNGGGFLLVRFAPLYFELPGLLTLMLVAGLATALLGTLWKLMQHDIKRMLACSTMGQMGFMLAQCGLGLFPAAVAHLCWHGLYKAYLFLASADVARESRFDTDPPPGIGTLLLALACGVLGSYAFALAAGKPWLGQDTTLVLVAVAFIAASQFALTLLRSRPLARLPAAAAATAALGLAYGASIRGVEGALAPAVLAQPLPLGAVHLAAIGLLVGAWLALLLSRRSGRDRPWPQWALALYVRALNGSQPHPATVTAQRNHYTPY